MEGYLGEKKVNIKKHPIYKNYTPTDWAMYFIERYGQIDGGHHKLWVLDQVARILKGSKITLKVASWENGTQEDRIEVGNPSKKYLKWVKYMKGDLDENGDEEYGYDEGIAP